MDLHDHLGGALQARLEVARAAQQAHQFDDIIPFEWFAALPDALAVHIAANDPATEIRRVEALLRVVERHTATEETNVEWFDSPVTGKAKCCPSCRPDPDEVTHWSPPVGQAGVEPEGFVRSYVLSPCPTIRDLAAGEGIEP